MALKITSTPVRLVIEISGEIDHHNAAVFRIEADEAIQKYLSPNVRIDFGGVTFMDSSGIGFVMGRYKLAKSCGANVEVINLSRRIYSMMRLAGLEKFMTLKMSNKEGK